MSKRDDCCGCLIMLLIILFSEALLPIVCLPFTAPFIIAELYPESRTEILAVFAVIVVGLTWFWLRSRAKKRRQLQNKEKDRQE